MAFQKKTSATSEAALVNATGNFKKALGELKSGFELVAGLEDKVEELQATIAAKEDKITALDTEFQEKQRQAQVNLELTIKAEKDKAVESILVAQGKVAIEKSNLNAIQKSLTDLQNSFDTKLSEETSKAYSKAAGEYKSKSELLEASFSTKEAENKAKIFTLEQQNKFLADQVTMWKGALDAEREAGIKRAQAQGSVNLTVPSQGK